MALVVSFRAASESFMEHTKERRHVRYRGTIGNIEGAREGSASGGEVLADHSTDGSATAELVGWGTDAQGIRLR